MISLCILTRNNPVNMIIDFFDRLARKHKIDYEVCIGDNTPDIEYRMKSFYTNYANEYIKITDKELFRMGIPFAHNRIASIANSYHIFYLDSDEFPVWINPDLDDLYDIKYIPMCLRADFCTPKEIEEIYNKLSDVSDPNEIIKILDGKEITQQDRLYNSRYAKFNGVCHSIFHVPPEFRSNSIGAVICHCNTIRDRHKRSEYTNPLIYEQYARQNINPFLASSDTVLEWGKGKTHQYKDYKEFIKKCRQKT